MLFAVIKVRVLKFCAVVRACVEFDGWFYEGVSVGECLLQCNGRIRPLLGGQLILCQS